MFAFFSKMLPKNMAQWRGWFISIFVIFAGRQTKTKKQLTQKMKQNFPSSSKHKGKSLHFIFQFSLKTRRRRFTFRKNRRTKIRLTDLCKCRLQRKSLGYALGSERLQKPEKMWKMKFHQDGNWCTPYLGQAQECRPSNCYRNPAIYMSWSDQ